MSDGAAIRRVRWYHPPLAALGSLLLTVLAAVALMVWYALAYRNAMPLARLAHDFNFGCIVTGAQEAGLLGMSLWLLSRVNDPALPARFRRPSLRLLLAGVGVAIALMLGVALFAWLCDTFLHTRLGDDTLPFRPTSLTQLPLGFLVVAVLAPLAEESFFRGLLMGWLGRHGGRWFAVTGQALVFALVHLKWLTPGGVDGWLLTAELVAMGFVLGLLAWRTGNLWVSMTAHAVNNGCAILLLFLLPA